MRYALATTLTGLPFQRRLERPCETFVALGAGGLEPDQMPTRFDCPRLNKKYASSRFSYQAAVMLAASRSPIRQRGPSV
jgi:hypothetical protein